MTYSKTFYLNTKEAQSPSETFSDLILLPDPHSANGFTLELEFKVEKQNRKINPNTWEFFWIFWSYQKEEGDNKKTNYLAFKTNGLEVGKAFEVVGQEFLWTDSKVRFETGKWYRIKFIVAPKQFDLSVNDIHFIFPDELPTATYQRPGSIGLYTEDAAVTVKNVKFSSSM